MSWKTIEIKKCDQGYMVTVSEEKSPYWVCSLNGSTFSSASTMNTYAVETGESIIKLLQSLLEEEDDTGT